MKQLDLSAVSLLLLAASCGQGPVTKQTPTPTKAESPARPTAEFMLQSPGFKDEQPVPDLFSNYRENKSPALSWSGAPGPTKSFALICEDPDAPAGTFTHWLLYNLPVTATTLPEGFGRDEVLPDGTRQLRNDFGRIGYDGPRPPPGKLHHYIFTLYALGKLLDPVPNKTGLLAAMSGHILAQTKLTGTYQR